MQVQVSGDAAEFVRLRGGRLWVWAAYPRRCCAATPPLMHAAVREPPGVTGFRSVPGAGLELSFRGLGDRQPDMLEIGLRGRRRPRVEAYWDGCVLAM